MQSLFEGKSGTAVSLVTTVAERDQLMGVFRSVAAEEGWLPQGDLERYRDVSVYLAGTVDGRIVGGLQFVPGSTVGSLPCASVWPEVGLCGRREAGHVLILALERGSRVRYGLFWLLGLALWQQCRRRGIEELWLEATPPTLRVYQRLGWPLAVRAACRPHWGEPCFLTSMTVAAVETSVRARAGASTLYCELIHLADRESMGP